MKTLAICLLLVLFAGCDYATHTRSYEITPERTIKTSGPAVQFRLVTTDTGKTYLVKVEAKP